MRKVLLLCLFITYFSFLSAQKRNAISFKIGEVAYTDWKNRYGIQPTLSYSHLCSNRLKVSTDISGYFWERLNELLSLPVGTVEKKIFVESSFKLGYQFKSNDNLKISAGTGLSMRLRNDNIIVSSGITNGGWHETIVFGYGGIEIGGVLYFESNYLLSDKFSIGVYSQANLYLPKTDIENTTYTHKSPSAFSFGLSTSFYFGKPAME